MEQVRVLPELGNSSGMEDICVVYVITDDEAAPVPLRPRVELLDHELESRLGCTLGLIAKPLTATAKPSQELVPSRSTAAGQQESAPRVLMREGVTVCERELRFSQPA
jgi:hypothetical protein